MQKSSSQAVVIAIDGYSSCGKSTLAKQLAKALDFIFIDTGAMYRAVTLYFIQQKVNINNEEEVLKALDYINIEFKNCEGLNTTFLNGSNVEDEIRNQGVSNKVSEVSAITSVRKKMVALQRQMSGNQSVVMDGRDIGTVVFPNADIKFFVTADPIVRAQRRFNELVAKNQTTDLAQVISNLQHRDKIDTSRTDSPLRQADDAIVLDNTNLTVNEQFEYALGIIKDKISSGTN